MSIKKQTKKQCIAHCLFLLNGASDGNRTRILTLARLRSTTELHLRTMLIIQDSLLKLQEFF